MWQGWRGRTSQLEDFRGQMSLRNSLFVIGNKKARTAGRKRRLFLSTAPWEQTSRLELSIGQTFPDTSFFHPGNKIWQFLHVPVRVSFDSGDKSIQSHESSHSSKSSSWTCFLKKILWQTWHQQRTTAPRKTIVELANPREQAVSEPSSGSFTTPGSEDMKLGRK